MPDRTWFEIKCKADVAEIYLYDEIGMWGVPASKFIQELKSVKARDIHLHINSPGGSTFDGMAIYNTLKKLEANVTSYVDGVAASIAGVIALAGRKVVASENSFFMIHNPWVMSVGDAEQLRKDAELLDKVTTQSVNIFTAKTGKDEDEIRRCMSEETWFTGPEAMEFGLVDEVIESRQIAACAIRPEFRYLKVPQQLTPAPKAENQKEDTMPNTNVQTPPASPEGAETVPAEAPALKVDNRGDIYELCDVFGCPQLARDFVARGLNLSEAKAEIMKAKASEPIHVPGSEDITREAARQKKPYSLSKAFLEAADNAGKITGFEAEVSQEIQRKLPASLQSKKGGFFYPMGAGLDAHTSYYGIELVFDVPGTFIELLRNRMLTRKLGATILAGLQGPVTFPKQTGAGTAYWVAENSGGDVSDVELTLGTTALSPKTLQSSTAFSRQLLAQQSLDTDNIVRNDMANIHALALDLAAYHGSGTSNQPTGVYKTTGVGTEAFGGASTRAHMLGLVSDVNVANALTGNLAFVMESIAAGAAAAIQEVATYGTTFLWQGRLDQGTMIGYPAYSTSQLSTAMSTLDVSGGSGHGCIFGDWTQLIFGLWGALEIIVDPYRLKKQGMIEITSFQMADICLRQPSAFSVATGLTA